jgi:hypothetical protein
MGSPGPGATTIAGDQAGHGILGPEPQHRGLRLPLAAPTVPMPH